MIEIDSDHKRFQTENIEGDLFLHVVPVEEGVHPVVNRPALLFIRNLSTGRTYYYSFEHPDSLPDVTNGDFLETLICCSNRKWAIDQKAFTQLVDLPNIYDLNLAEYLENNTTIDPTEYDTPSHFLVRKHSVGHGRVNLSIPLMKHLEAFNELADDVKKVVKNYEPDTPFIRFNDLIIRTLGEIEKQGIFVDREKFQKHFETDVGPPGITHSQYNVYTSTGRPSNRFGGINYAALNQTNGSRSCFCSRYGEDGRIVVIDYTAFHPRIIARLTNYNLPTTTDFNEYMAKLYFHKKEVDETDISNAKQLTFRQLYGGVEDKYAHIKYLANLKTFINEQWEFFQKNGHVVTPFFKRKITTHHIQDPNPNKVFNYILQATEGEIAIPKIQAVQAYLVMKKTKAILYTYDAVLYDFHKDDGMETLNNIRNIMSFDGTFPMKTYVGNSYQDVRLATM
jgi:hypothetical protein